MSDTLSAYKDHLYSGGNSGKHLLKCVSGVSEEDCESQTDNNKLRLSELYFDPYYYDVDIQASPQATQIDSFQILPDNEVVNFKAKLTEKVIAKLASFTSIAEINTSFTQCLKEAGEENAQNTDTSITDKSLPANLIEKDFKGYLLRGEFPSELTDKYSNPDVFRPYMAWKHIDHMYPETERKEYFLIERMHTLTKLVFILSIMRPPPSSSPQNTDLLGILNKIMTFMVKQSLEYMSVGDPQTTSSIDDSTVSNVELSRRVRENSDKLLENKEIVQKFQDNLRSLVGVDKSVQAARRRSWYFMLFLVVLLVLAVAGMAYGYARGRTGEVYLVGGILVLGVFAFEAFKGAERLMVLPASILG